MNRCFIKRGSLFLIKDVRGWKAKLDDRGRLVRGSLPVLHPRFHLHGAKIFRFNQVQRRFGTRTFLQGRKKNIGAVLAWRVLFFVASVGGTIFTCRSVRANLLARWRRWTGVR